MPDNRVKVIRRLWFILCGFECCSFLLASAINGLTATIYWKLLNWQDNIYASISNKATRTVLAALMFGIFASLISLARLFYWRWAGEKEKRLQLFAIATILGTAALTLPILGLLFRGHCVGPGSCSGQAYRIIVHLQVKIARDAHSRQSLTMSQEACLTLAIAMFCLLVQAFIGFMLYFEELFFAVRYYCPSIVYSMARNH
jgi:hypothetical protein